MTTRPSRAPSARPSAQSAAVAASHGRWLILASMLAAIAVVTALAWWDEQREADAALEDLESEQSVLASSVASDLRAHLIARHADGHVLDVGVTPADLLDVGEPMRAEQLLLF